MKHLPSCSGHIRWYDIYMANIKVGQIWSTHRDQYVVVTEIRNNDSGISLYYRDIVFQYIIARDMNETWEATTAIWRWALDYRVVQ